MSIFNKFGYYIIKLFSITGMLILSIPRILKKINYSDIKDKLNMGNLKNNISTIREDIKLIIKYHI